MNIFYVANARMPTEKAHGIQIAKMCEAFIERGAHVTLIVPHRKTILKTVQEFYALKSEVQVIRLPIINTYSFGSIGFIIGSASFIVSSFLFILWRHFKKERFIVYTVDMDTFSSSFLPMTGIPVFTEMHNGKYSTIAQLIFFRFLKGVITVNQILADEFKNKFRYSHVKYIVEPNGVDIKLFQPRDKNKARQRLNLPKDEKIILYVGRFFDWKGLGIISTAANIDINMQWYLVGGTAYDFTRVTQVAPESSMTFIGSVPQTEVVWWVAAADALVVLGTKHDRQSYYYTSPMKLFEYLLSERIIIASETPAIRQIISEKEALFYIPDSAEDLALKAREVITSPDKFQNRVEAATKLGNKYSWNNRAERILKFINETSKDAI